MVRRVGSPNSPKTNHSTNKAPSGGDANLKAQLEAELSKIFIDQGMSRKDAEAKAKKVAAKVTLSVENQRERAFSAVDASVAEDGKSTGRSTEELFNSNDSGSLEELIEKILRAISKKKKEISKTADQLDAGVDAEQGAQAKLQMQVGELASLTQLLAGVTEKINQILMAPAQKL